MDNLNFFSKNKKIIRHDSQIQVCWVQHDHQTQKI
jgi:hypothetical protein